MLSFMNAEIYKLLKSRSFRVIALLLALVNIITSVGVVVYDKTNYQGWKTIDILASSPMFLCVGIFAAIVFTSDYNDGTVRQYVYRGISRTAIYFGRLFSIILVSLTFPLFCLLFSTLPLSLYYGFGDIKESAPLYAIRVAVTVVVAITVYVLFTLLIAIFTRSVGSSIAVVSVCTTMIPMLLIFIDFFDRTEYIQYWITSIMTSFMEIGAKINMTYVGIVAAIIVGLTTIECVAYNQQEF